jgi:hypothetical protein
METLSDRRDDHAHAVERWRSLLETARWAPSPHNIQPWRLRVASETEAELLYDPTRLLPETDPTGRFTMVGLGIFVECLAIAARAEGVELDARFRYEPLDPTADGLVPLATLSLAPLGAAEALTPDLVLRRRTSRLPFDGTAVDEALLAELVALAGGWDQTLTASSDPEFVRFVLELNRDTLFYDLADDRARREVGRWLRFSASEAARRPDGFSPAALGFPGWLLYVFFRGHRLLELPLLRSVIRSLYFRTTSGTRTVAWLRGPFERPEDWIPAGRMLARLWLTLTAHGVQLHPFGSIITNERAFARLQERIPAGEGVPWLIVRLGYSAEPPRSHRLSAQELLA